MREQEKIVEEIRSKWMGIKGKPVDISFPKSADPQVVACIVGAARGDVYDLLAFMETQRKEIRQLKMEIDGVTEQDIADTKSLNPYEN